MSDNDEWLENERQRPWTTGPSSPVPPESHRPGRRAGQVPAEEGRRVIRRRKYLIVGAADEDKVDAAIEVLSQEAPANMSVHTR